MKRLLLGLIALIPGAHAAHRAMNNRQKSSIARQRVSMIQNLLKSKRQELKKVPNTVLTKEIAQLEKELRIARRSKRGLS